MTSASEKDWTLLRCSRHDSEVYDLAVPRALNVSREARRAAGRHQTVQSSDVVDVQADATRNVVLAELLATLAMVSQRQREVVVLRMLEGLSTKETARAPGCRPGTVKAHLHRALITLTGVLDEDVYTQGEST
jgi:RNA polymerase sigma-70 factor (ECF subfamily)